MRTMRARHVLGLSGAADADVAAHMAGHTTYEVKYFQRACGGAHPQLFAEQRVRHRVEMTLELDVIVDIERDPLPCRGLKRLSGKRSERRLVEALEQLTPA